MANFGVNEIEFGTDGFRGIIADDFTYENVRRITVAIAKYILETTPDKKTISIGFDPRFTADKFAEFSAEILAAFGFKILLSSKVVPTPVVAYAAIVEENSAGAVMFTASHNPKEYLGIKFIPPYGGPATKEMTDRIVELIDGEEPQKAAGTIEKRDFSENYFKQIEKLIDFDLIKREKIKFLYDGLYSSSIGYFDEILNRNGIKYETVNMHHDPNFGGGLPEPKAKFMTKAQKGTLTLANDGDADRYGVLDEEGEYVTPNVVMAILLKYLKEKGHTGKMIKTVGVSGLIDRVAEKLNVETITTPVGFKWLSEEMRKNETILAGEDSGGLSTGLHIPEKDGIFANLLILEAVSYYQKPLSILKQEIIKFAGQDFVQTRVDVKLKTDLEKQKVMDEVAKAEEFAGLKVKDTLKIDGIKFFLEDGSWILMRKSGTEPLLRFYIEAGNEIVLKELENFINNNYNQ